MAIQPEDCGEPYTGDPDGDWTSQVWKGIKFSLATAAIVLLLSWLLNLPLNRG